MKNKLYYWFLLLIAYSTACIAPPQIPTPLTKITFEYGPTDMAIHQESGNVYILNHGDAVGVFNGLEQVAVVETPYQPDDIAIDQQRGWVYLTHEYEGLVTVMRDTEVITSLETWGRTPSDVAIDPHSGWAYVVGPHRKMPPIGERPVVGGHITLFDGPEQVGAIELGEVFARHVVVDPVQGYIYVGGARPGGRGVVIVLKDMEEVARIELDSYSPKFMEVNPQTGEVFVVDDHRLYRFVQGALAQTMIPVEDQGFLGNMQVHPTTGDVYLIEWSGFGLTEAIVVRHMREVARVPIGSGSFKMDIDPLSGNVYLADYLNHQVTVMHGREVITTLETGTYPYGVGVNPTNGRVYISNTHEGTVTVLGLPEE